MRQVIQLEAWQLILIGCGVIVMLISLAWLEGLWAIIGLVAGFVLFEFPLLQAKVIKKGR